MTLTSFNEVVVSASGNIPGHTHESIQRMVEECGAKFEKLKVSDCTHLITTRAHVHNGTKKVHAAWQGSNCEVVGIQWLLDSVRDQKPASTDAYVITPVAGINAGDLLPQESSLLSPDSNKRKLDAETDIEEEPSKALKNNVKVHRRRLIALVDDRFDTQGSEVAVWMDGNDVHWDVTLVGNPVKNQAADTIATAPAYKISLYRLQILYNFSAGTHRTWFRQVDAQIEEGELYGNGDLQSAKIEFKRLFKKLACVCWEERQSLQLGLPDMNAVDARHIFIQPQTENQQHIGDPDAERTEITLKIPSGVSRMLQVLFGRDNRTSINHFFTDVVVTRLMAANCILVDEHALRIAIAILGKLNVILTEPPRPVTRSSSPELMVSQANYLRSCYFGLLGLKQRLDSELHPPNLEWLKEELQNVHLLHKLRVAVDTSLRNNAASLPIEVLQQAYQTLGLSEIKRVRRGSGEYNGLVNYLKLTVGTLHTIEYKEIVNVFRIQRHGEFERYHQWRAENSHRIGQRYLLWHGSGSEKFIGILSQGLRNGLFVKSAVGMFGSGIYFADMSGKSARYCTGPGGQIFMLLCEVELGMDPLIVQQCDRNAPARLHLDGKVGVIAQGCSNHRVWTNAKSVHRRLDGILMPDVAQGRDRRGHLTLAYNEYVVYNPAQVQLRYLFQLKVA